ncbi:MAG: hypothetical protein WCF79_19815, partial [Rhodomicrobium sp.]
RMSFCKALRIRDLLSLTKWPLNLIQCQNFFIYWDEQKSVKYIPTSLFNYDARFAAADGAIAILFIINHINDLLSLTCWQGAFS